MNESYNPFNRPNIFWYHSNFTSYFNSLFESGAHCSMLLSDQNAPFEITILSKCTLRGNCYQSASVEAMLLSKRTPWGNTVARVQTSTLLCYLSAPSILSCYQSASSMLPSYHSVPLKVTLSSVCKPLSATPLSQCTPQGNTVIRVHSSMLPYYQSAPLKVTLSAMCTPSLLPCYHSTSPDVTLLSECTYIICSNIMVFPIN